MKKIVLFYKKLVSFGGAERLLLEEYANFKFLGYKADIVSFEIGKDIFLKNKNADIDKKNVIALNGRNPIMNIYRLIRYMRLNKNALYLISSGHVDFYLASLFVAIDYSLHLHQPAFMSFTEQDKYSLFMKEAYRRLISGSYASEKFIGVKKNISLAKKLFINLRAVFSILAIKKARHVFVLSQYAKREKKIMYGVDPYVFQAALNKKIFHHKPKRIKGYDNFKHKILTVGRLDANKRIDELIRAFQIFLRDAPDSILLIGGTGREYKSLKDLTGDLGLEKNVKFLGFIPEDRLFDYYATADLFVSIDWADFRISAYEALAAGTKALLSSETEADQRLIDSGYLYLTVPEKASTAMAMKKALDNKNIIKRDNLNKLLEDYTWENYFHKISKVLEDDKK